MNKVIIPISVLALLISLAAFYPVKQDGDCNYRSNIYRRVTGRDGPWVALYVNNTFYTIGYGEEPTAIIPQSATPILPGIFDLVPINKQSLDPNSFLAVVSGSTGPYYLVNPTYNTKWQMYSTALANSYGFDVNKVFLVGQEFLDRYQTTFYF